MSATGITRTYDLPSFKRIEVDTGLSVRIAAGQAQAITAVAANEDDLDRLNLVVRDETLRASLRREPFGLGWFGHRGVTLAIAAPEVERVEAGAGSNVSLAAGPTPHLKLRSSAGSRLTAEAIDSERL